MSDPVDHAEAVVQHLEKLLTKPPDSTPLWRRTQLKTRIQDALVALQGPIEPHEVVGPPPPMLAVPQTTNDFALLRSMLWQLVVRRGWRRILEVGTDVGDTPRLFSAALTHTGGRLWTIDLKPPVNDWPKTWTVPNVTFLTGDSLTVPWTEPLHAVFLDGNHHADHLWKELERFGPCVEVGGALLLHDTCHGEYGKGILDTLRRWTLKEQLPWTEYPYQHGLAVIEVTHAVLRQ